MAANQRATACASYSPVEQRIVAKVRVERRPEIGHIGYMCTAAATRRIAAAAVLSRLFERLIVDRAAQLVDCLQQQCKRQFKTNKKTRSLVARSPPQAYASCESLLIIKPFCSQLCLDLPRLAKPLFEILHLAFFMNIGDNFLLSQTNLQLTFSFSIRSISLY